MYIAIIKKSIITYYIGADSFYFHVNNAETNIIYYLMIFHIRQVLSRLPHGHVTFIQSDICVTQVDILINQCYYVHNLITKHNTT